MKLSLLPLLAFCVITPPMAGEAMIETVALKVYQALPESEREAFLAGLVDGYVATASERSQTSAARPLLPAFTVLMARACASSWKVASLCRK